MFNSYTECKRFGFNQQSLVFAKLKYISCRMAGCQYSGICYNRISISSNHSLQFLFLNEEVSYFFLKKKYPATRDNLFADCCYNMRELVGANMRMCFVQYIFIRSKLVKKM